MEKSNDLYKLFQQQYLDIATNMRENSGIDPGKKDYYSQNSKPIEIDTKRLLVLT